LKMWLSQSQPNSKATKRVHSRTSSVW